MEQSTTQSLDDYGTRYAHYRELLDLWEAGWQVLNEKSHQNNEDLGRKANLAIVIDMLTRQLDIKSDFGGNRLALKKEIDAVHQSIQLEEPK